MSFVRSLPLVLLVAAPALAQEKHQLRLRFVPGTIVNYTMSQVMDMKMNMNGQEMGNTKMTLQMFMSTKVKGVEGTVADIEQEISRVKAIMNNPMMNIDFDSADKDSDPGVFGDLADMVGQKTKLKLSDMGKMTDVKMDDDAAASAKGAGVDVEQMLSQSVTMLPEGPIAIGDTWKSSQKMPLGQMGEMDSEVINKLISVDDKHIVVGQVIKMNSDEAELPGGMEIEKMEASGTTKIDRRTGMPAEMNMTIKMKMSGQMGVDMVIKQTVRPTPPAKKAADDAGKAPAKTGK